MKIAPFKLERFFARYEFKAPYLLCSSDCEAMTIRELLDLEPGAREQFDAQWLGYTESEGGMALREAITGLYERIEPGQVLTFTGAEEAIFVFFNALLDRGDHVIVHTPCYQSLTEIATAIGCEVTRWQTHEADDWELDLDLLRRSIKPNTRAIVVNCPHNPTGYQMQPDTQRQIVVIARQHGLLLFSDEVYRHLEQDPSDTLPAACDLYENAVALGVMSKTYGLAGLRVGWIATRSADARARMAAFKDYTTICSSAPSEFLSLVALRHRDDIARRNVAITRANLDLLDKCFARHADLFSWKRPRAGSTAFPGLKLDVSVEAFCEETVERSGVLLLPGTCFDDSSRNFRVGFGRKNLPEVLEHFEAFLAERVKRA
ncbi:MAG TPA: aminotransferase class I/II-fold pyridoxal phosphate-dependent enzyme [Aggregatilineales bacterium]|nr:aminotransferase class I/II-fold pyridoxal phosphate-dependent enzyme [Aggregatilineales bacterium]